MLTLLSTVGEILRALYFYGADYLMFICDKKERLLHKEQLVALLEHGREKVTLEDLGSVTLTEPLSARMKIEDISPDLPLLLFKDEALSLTTFAEYRESKILDARSLLPAWWSVPLPLLHIKADRISLNERAQALIPGGVSSFAGKTEKIRSERIITVRWKKQERTFALEALSEDTYLLEDISGDFEMAEDLLWWATAGRAFVRRMEENGLSVKRLLPDEAAPPDSAEVIPCSWDGELVGKLAFIMPEKPEEKPVRKSEPKPTPEPVPEPEEAPRKKSPAAKKRAPAKKKSDDAAALLHALSDDGALDVSG